MTDEKFEPIPVTKILEMIPHRYPILLVDRIVDLKKGLDRYVDPFVQ